MAGDQHGGAGGVQAGGNGRTGQGMCLRVQVWWVRGGVVAGYRYQHGGAGGVQVRVGWHVNGSGHQVEGIVVRCAASKSNLFDAACMSGCSYHRTLVSEEPVAYDPERALADVVSYTHYLPRHWRGRAHTDEVQVG